MNTVNTKTFLRNTRALAVTTALALLSAQAGHCDINPQPLPPRWHPHPVADFLHHLLALAHLIRL